MQNPTVTIISQYADSPVINQMIDNLNSVIDPNYDFNQFYSLIWNIDTAVGYGLDVWGRIVGIQRVLAVNSGVFLGYTGLTGSSGDSYNAAIYYSGTTTTSNFTLTDEAFRQLIFAKAAANITNGSIEAINVILMDILFPNRGNCYAQDNQNMTMTYVFTFPLQDYEIAIVTTSGVLPTPAGVLANVTHP